MARNCLEVELNSQAGRVDHYQLPIPDRIPATDQFVTPGDVELGEGLLDQEIGRAQVEVQASRQRHRSDRAMWRDLQVLSSGHRCDLLARENAATMGKIHLNHINCSECG